MPSHRGELGSSCFAAARRVASTLLLGTALLAAPAFAMTRITPAPTGIGQNDDGMGSSISIHADVAAVGMPSARPNPSINSGAVEIFRQSSGVWAREAFLQPVDVEGGIRFGTAVAVGDNIVVVTAHRTTTGYIYTFARNGSSWTQVDEFPVLTFPVSPYSIALSGQTLLVTGGNVVKVYVRSGNGWTQQAVLGPAPREPDGIFPPPGEVFGGAVAVDGDLAVVPSIDNEPSSNTTEILLYVFERSGEIWTQQDRLDLGALPLGEYVNSIALSGSTAIIATSATSFPAPFQGDVRIFARSQDAWTEQAVENGGAVMPYSVSVAIDGDRALVGSPGDTVFGEPAAGTAYVFARSGDTWTREAHIYDAAGDGNSTQFGTSVALSGASALVGSPGAYAEGGLTGKASAFALDGGTWNLTQSIDDGSARANEIMGQAVALSGDTLLAGAPNARSQIPYAFGAAYIYERAGSVWTESARLAPTADTTQGFGSAVSLSADTAAVGASSDEDIGAAYVYVRDAGDWPLQQKLSGAGSDLRYFGWSLALDGDFLAVSEPGNVYGNGAAPPGVVHLFGRSGSIWSEQSTIQPADATANDAFGFTLAKSGDTLLVGAPAADVDINTNAGAVYAYVRSGTDWNLQAKIVAPIPAKGTAFGLSVAVAGDIALIGSGGFGAQVPLAGAAYIYHRSGADWIWQATLDPPAGTEREDSYGRAVALSADATLALVSMPYVNPYYQAPTQGTVFAFRFDGTQWTGGTAFQGSPPPAPYPVADGFGISTSIFGTDIAFGAPGDGLTGAAYVTSIADEIFANGFDPAP